MIANLGARSLILECDRRGHFGGACDLGRLLSAIAVAFSVGQAIALDFRRVCDHNRLYQSDRSDSFGGAGDRGRLLSAIANLGVRSLIL